MAVERFANNAQTTLNGSISAGATTLVVTSAALFPTAGRFRLIIEDEILIVTAVSGTTFTVLRGQEGTTDASHASGSTVTHVVTADSIIRTIPFLSLDAPPASGNWTAVNQGAATITDLDSGALFVEIPSGSGDNIRGWTRNLAASSNYTITALFTPIWSGENFARIGLALYDGTKLITFWWDSGSSTTILSFATSKWNSVTSFNADFTTGRTLYDIRNVAWGTDLPTWFRIRDDGSTINLEVSKDKMQWFVVGTIGNTAFLTPTKVGVFLEGFNSSKKNGLTLLSWKEE